jgi:hypothetical protein
MHFLSKNNTEPAIERNLSIETTPRGEKCRRLRRVTRVRETKGTNIDAGTHEKCKFKKMLGSAAGVYKCMVIKTRSMKNRATL